MSFYHTPEGVAQYIEMARGYDGREIIERLRKHLPINSTVLELGSGPGVDLQLLARHYEVTGSDYSSEFLDRLADMDPDLDLLDLDAVTLNTARTFDGIFSNKVLHHLTDAELATSMDNQLRILNPGGIVCHTFWKGDHEEEIHGMNFNYHQAASLRAMLEEKFDILELELYTEMQPHDSLVLIARKRP